MDRFTPSSSLTYSSFMILAAGREKANMVFIAFDGSLAVLPDLCSGTGRGLLELEGSPSAANMEGLINEKIPRLKPGSILIKIPYMVHI
jgi:hypothetical protein